MTKSDPLEALRRANERTPPYGAPAFRFQNEIRPPERPYDYYEAHPEHRPRPLSRRQLRRRAIREG